MRLKLDDLNKLVEPALKERGLSPKNVASILFYPDGFEVEYFVRDYRGKFMEDKLLGDEAHTAISYFKYEDRS